MATYGIVLFYPDSPQADELMLLHVLAQPITLPDGLNSSRALADTAATTETVFSIKHAIPPSAPVEVGTVTFAAAGTVGTYAATADVTINAGETFSIVAPATADATLANITFTVVAETVPDTRAGRVNLEGLIISRTVVTGRLTPMLGLQADIDMGQVSVTGRLSVTHSWALFNAD